MAKEFRTTIKCEIDMELKNLEYVTKQFKELGYGEDVIAQLPKALASGEKTVALHGRKVYDNGEAALRPTLAKSKEDEFYFFNRHTVTFTNKDGHTQPLEAIAYVNKSHNHTVDQIVSMLKGGAVESKLLDKDKNEYVGWSVIDGKELDRNGYAKVTSYHSNYGFDLHSVMSQYRFDQLGDPEQREAIYSRMRKGEIVQMTADNKTYNVAPGIQFKTGKIWDEGMRPLSKSERMDLMQPEAREALVAKEEKNKAQRNGHTQGVK